MRNLFRLTAGALAIASLGATSVQAQPCLATAQTVVTPISSAASLVEAFGLDTHFSYRDHADAIDFDSISQKLVSMGVHHIRDGEATHDPLYLSRLNQLAAEGIKHSVGFNVTATPELVKSTLDQQGGSRNIDFVEPQNEFDNSKDPDWAQKIHTELAMLNSVVHDNPQYAHIAVLGPSFASLSKHYQEFGSDRADGANLHNATCGDAPSVSASDGYDFVMPKIKQTIPGAPVWITETGYDDDANSPCGVPTDIAANYVVRNFLYLYSAYHAHHIYYNMLTDQPFERGFRDMGFFDVSGNPKPQYFSMASFLHLLSDPGQNFTPRRISVILNGADCNVGSVLVQKRNGTFYLALWQERSNWNRFTREYVSTPPQHVSVTLPFQPQSTGLYTYDTQNWSLHRSRLPVARTLSIPVTGMVSVVSFH